MRLVDREQRPGLAGEPAERVVEPVAGQHQADVRQRRLGEDEGDVARRERRLERAGVVERDHPRLAGHRSRQAAGLGHHLAVLEDHQR